MKNSTLLIAPLALAGTAMADFAGVTVMDAFHSNGMTVIRLGASHTDANDQLNTLAGIPGGAAMSIEAAGGNTMYQDAFGGDFVMSINPAFFPFFPTLAVDSFLTAGNIWDAGMNPATNGLLNAGDMSQSASGGFSSSDGAITGIPYESYAYGLEVGFAQISLVGTLDLTDLGITAAGADGNVIEAVVNLQGKNAAGETYLAEGLAFGVGVVPAPGAMALLGLAGIASRRRRA
tara:strand:+ start:394 stop:1092 length:699 start_codon:yes stop_codon:yes gene_type:complete